MSEIIKIEQVGIVNLHIMISTTDEGKKVLSQTNDFTHDEIVIRKDKLREVALAICPELSQPELKAVKTAEDLEMAFAINAGGQIVYRRKFDEMVKFIKDQFSQPKEEQPEKIVSELKQSNKEDIESVTIYKWLESKKYQTDRESTGEYLMYFDLDMPKILNAFRNEFQSKQPTIEELKSEVERLKDELTRVFVLSEQRLSEVEKAKELIERAKNMAVLNGLYELAHDLKKFLEGTKTK